MKEQKYDFEFYLKKEKALAEYLNIDEDDILCLGTVGEINDLNDPDLFLDETSGEIYRVITITDGTHIILAVT